MFRLLYISTARAEMDMVTLQAILQSAQISNRARGLTGLLIFDGNRFMQYLEGEEGAVRTLFATIKQDPRHYAVATLRESYGEERQCADWDMAVLCGINGAEFDRQVQRVTNLVDSCDALTATELKGFVYKLVA